MPTASQVRQQRMTDAIVSPANISAYRRSLSLRRAHRQPRYVESFTSVRPDLRFVITSADGKQQRFLAAFARHFLHVLRARHFARVGLRGAVFCREESRRIVRLAFGGEIERLD